MTNVEKNKIVAIGDVHGCLDELNDLLEKIPKDRLLVFLGDYVDRGPKSAGVLDRIIELSEERECVFLMGNHEAMMVDAWQGIKPYLWHMNGGTSTLDSYGKGEEADAKLEYHIDWLLKNTELYYETDDYFFVHAGIPAFMTTEEAIKTPGIDYEMIWGRSHWSTRDEWLSWDKTVVCGHTIQNNPIIGEKRIGIDTGAFCEYGYGSGALTAILLPEKEIIQSRRKFDKKIIL